MHAPRSCRMILPGEKRAPDTRAESVTKSMLCEKTPAWRAVLFFADARSTLLSSFPFGMSPPVSPPSRGQFFLEARRHGCANDGSQSCAMLTISRAGTWKGSEGNLTLPNADLPPTDSVPAFNERQAVSWEGYSRPVASSRRAPWPGARVSMYPAGVERKSGPGRGEQGHVEGIPSTFSAAAVRT